MDCFVVNDEKSHNETSNCCGPSRRITRGFAGRPGLWTERCLPAFAFYFALPRAEISRLDLTAFCVSCWNSPAHAARLVLLLETAETARPPVGTQAKPSPPVTCCSRFCLKSPCNCRHLGHRSGPSPCGHSLSHVWELPGGVKGTGRNKKVTGGHGLGDGHGGSVSEGFRLPVAQRCDRSGDCPVLPRCLPRPSCSGVYLF